jgi:hypothetical protein
MNVGDMIMMPVPISRYTEVCALLGGVALAGLATEQHGGGAASAGGTTQTEKPSPTAADQTGAGEPSSAGAGASQGANDGEIDAHGHPWSAELHASTKGKTKDGLWRMKVGVSRPDPLPGFPVDNGGQSAATGTSPATPTPSATSQTATDQGSGQPAISGAEEEDEFAAFREAAAASNAADDAAKASVPERQYSDADLGALCNQAAVKLGDPSPIKEIIAAFTPEGQVAHSRNIPAERRAEFVKAVEDKAGIQFAG